MKCKKVDLLNLWHCLENLKQKKKNVTFSYFIAKNKMIIKEEANALSEAQEASEAFKAYDLKRAEAAEKMSEKDAKGQPIVRNNQYVIEKKMKQFEKEVEKLKKEFKTVIDDRVAQVEAFKKLLDEEIEFTGYPISLTDLPDDIEPAVMECLLTTELIAEG